jgi:hypothetical protein
MSHESSHLFRTQSSFKQGQLRPGQAFTDYSDINNCQYCSHLAAADLCQILDISQRIWVCNNTQNINIPVNQLAMSATEMGKVSRVSTLVFVYIFPYLLVNSSLRNKFT